MFYLSTTVHQNGVFDMEGKNLFLEAFLLTLPSLNHLVGSIEEFSKSRYPGNNTPYMPEVTCQESEVFLEVYDSEDTCLSIINAEATLPPLDNSAAVLPDFFDFTPSFVAYDFIEFLCEKFEGTFVGVYVRDNLYPVKIIDGKRIPCALALIDSEVR